MTIFYPTTGTQLSADCTSAVLGDTIQLDHTLTYTIPSGGIGLANKGAGTSYITIKSDGVIPAKLMGLPYNLVMGDPTSWRMTLAEGAGLAKLVATTDNPIFKGANGSHHWKFEGLHFTNAEGLNSVNNLLQASSGSEAVLADFCHHWWVYGCWFRPREEIGDLTTDIVTRSVDIGIFLNGDDHLVEYCSAQGFTGYYYPNPAIPEEVALGHGNGRDTRGFFYGGGVGNNIVRNCMFEGSGNNCWLGGGGGGVAYPEKTGEMTNTEVDSGTIADLEDRMEVGDLFTIRVMAIYETPNTTIGDPDGLSPTQLANGWATGVCESVTGDDITFSPLRSIMDFRTYRIKLNTGVTGGTFTLTYESQTTSAITVPTPLTVTGASNTNPITITTSTSHGLTTGDTVSIEGVLGNTEANTGQGLSSFDAGQLVWDVTVTGANTFTIPEIGNAAYTGGGKVKKRSALAASVEAALEALTTPPTVNLSSADELYVSAPTYGVEVRFADQTTLAHFSANFSGLTGSGSVGGRVEATWSEGSSPIHPEYAPDEGAVCTWGGVVPTNLLVQHCILPKYTEHEANKPSGKGCFEVKNVRNLQVFGNIFHGGPTNAAILEAKNQDGSAPWSTVEYVHFKDCVWTHTTDFVAMALTDGSNQHKQGNHVTIENCLTLNPAAPLDATLLGNSSVGGSDVTIKHCTLFTNWRLTKQVVGLDYDQDYGLGMSKGRDWLVENNVLIYTYGFFFTQNNSPGVPPFNYGDMRDGYVNFQAFNNLAIDVNNIYGLFGDQGGFWALHGAAPNWRVAGNLSDFYPDAPDIDPDALNSGMEFYFWELPDDSLYAAGNARDATDGEDVGVNMADLVAGLGFNPFTGEPVGPSNVVVGGRHRVTMQ